MAAGTKAANVFPHITIFCNGREIGDYFVSEKPQERSFIFETLADGMVVIAIEMDNDLQINDSEDRNVFIDGITITHVTPTRQ